MIKHSLKLVEIKKSLLLTVSVNCRAMQAPIEAHAATSHEHEKLMTNAEQDPD